MSMKQTPEEEVETRKSLKSKDEIQVIYDIESGNHYDLKTGREIIFPSEEDEI